MSTKPTRNGERWTKAEEAEILDGIKTGLSIRTIADRKQRTPGSIRSRLTRIACNLVLTNVPLREASTRTSIGVVQILAALEHKMDCKAAMTQPPKMEFNFSSTVSRKELQDAPRKRKIAYLQSIVDQQLNLRNAAHMGKTSFLWEVNEETLARDRQTQNAPVVTLDEVMEAVRAKYTGCTVEKVEEWVDVVPAGRQPQPPTRTLKSGIKIDWS